MSLIDWYVRGQPNQPLDHVGEIDQLDRGAAIFFYSLQSAQTSQPAVIFVISLGFLVTEMAEQKGHKIKCSIR